MLPRYRVTASCRFVTDQQIHYTVGFYKDTIFMDDGAYHFFIDNIHKEGEYYCGEFDTDDTDFKLAELIVTIQYACQRYYFGAMAEAYFTNKNHDASVNVRRKPKTLESFSRLSDEFTIDDVMRCFSLDQIGAAKMRVNRLLKDHLVEKIDEFVDNGTTKARYRKVGFMTQ